MGFSSPCKLQRSPPRPLVLDEVAPTWHRFQGLHTQRNDVSLAEHPGRRAGVHEVQTWKFDGDL